MVPLRLSDEQMQIVSTLARMCRTRRARSARRSYRPSDTWARPRLRPRANGPQPLFSECANSAGLRVVQSRSRVRFAQTGREVWVPVHEALVPILAEAGRKRCNDD
jgi:hypothetical protein